ncbi:FMN-dependent NADH-azoreductase [Spiroplasma endosymbiont of Aspidapion aeneum]|uniref:FMN-dependent NADH-azoreductase n=1 Tax=Spiroplasma endosymbiont of Aspidapion aeneum TaxID=3066276 RepID=UPI00313DFF32
MAKVLVLKVTMINDKVSYSTAILNKFIEVYKNKYKNDEIIELDLTNEPMAQKALTRDNMGNFWNKDDSEKYIDQLKSVDKLILASPMVNFNIPAILKNYIDHVFLADKLFSYKYSKKGDAIGLLDKLKVQIITTQGAPVGWYPFSSHTEYLRGLWEFAGAKINRPIVISGTKVEPYSKMDINDFVKSELDNIMESLKEF